MNSLIRRGPSLWVSDCERDATSTRLVSSPLGPRLEVLPLPVLSILHFDLDSRDPTEPQGSAKILSENFSDADHSPRCRASPL